MHDTGVPIAERQLLWKWLFALASFEQAERSIDAVLKKPLTEKDRLYVPLTSAAVIFYARPFTNSYGAGRLPESVVPPQYREFHTKALLMRDKIFAHSDAGHILPGVNLPLNQAVYLVAGKKGRFQNTNNSIKTVSLFRLVTVMDELFVTGKEYVSEFQHRYGKEFPTENGHYSLNIKGTPGPLWQRYTPLKSEP